MASIKRRNGAIQVQLRPEERMVLAGFAREVAELLGAGDGGPVEQPQDPLAALVGIDAVAPQRPDDPALQRLFPDAYDDDAAAAEFRRLAGGDLRRGKAANLAALADDVTTHGERIRLDADRADRWLSALNDIRLVLGVRLGVEDDTSRWRSGLAPDDPRQPLIAAYDWLTMLQDMLVETLL